MDGKKKWECFWQLGNELLYTLLFLTRALLHAMTDGLPAPPAAGLAEIDDVRTTEADFIKRLLSRAASEMFGMVANEIRAEESVRDALASALLTFVFAQLLDMLLRNKTCDDKRELWHKRQVRKSRSISRTNRRRGHTFGLSTTNARSSRDKRNMKPQTETNVVG